MIRECIESRYASTDENNRDQVHVAYAECDRCGFRSEEVTKDQRCSAEEAARDLKYQFQATHVCNHSVPAR